MMALSAWPARRHHPPLSPHTFRNLASSPRQPVAFHGLSYRFNLPMQLDSPGNADSHRMAIAQWRGCATGLVPSPLIHALPGERNVHAVPFLFLGDAQTNGHVDDFQNDKADHKAVNQRGPYAPQLGHYRSIGPADFLAGEDTREQGTDDAADTVHTERVERIVIAQRTFKRSGCEETNDTGNQANYDRGRGPDKARRRRDRDQSCDGARGYSQDTGLALDDPFGEH